MHSSEFLNALQLKGAVLSDHGNGVTEVSNLGDVAAELIAAQSNCVVCPLPELIRIRATGKDRAKFLHNFCTNNINTLKTGHVCEAFFTDVKAKVIAHGMIVAMPDSHEIWMLPGDEAAIVNHLNRYIITEDVTIDSVSEHAGFALIGPAASATMQSAGYTLNLNADGGVVEPEFSHLPLIWADTPVSIVSVRAESGADTWNKLTAAGATPSGSDVFHHFRILEGYPLIGVDITTDNLAPEADRNRQTICYTKGCYLGQEPIARLDAMGHVNRQMYRAKAIRKAAAEPDESCFVATSISRAVNEQVPALIVLPVKAAIPSQPIQATLSDGRPIEIVI